MEERFGDVNVLVVPSSDSVVELDSGIDIEELIFVSGASKFYDTVCIMFRGD